MSSSWSLSIAGLMMQDLSSSNPTLLSCLFLFLKLCGYLKIARDSAWLQVPQPVHDHPRLGDRLKHLQSGTCRTQFLLFLHLKHPFGGKASSNSFRTALARCTACPEAPIFRLILISTCCFWGLSSSTSTQKRPTASVKWGASVNNRGSKLGGIDPSILPNRLLRGKLDMPSSVIAGSREC